MKSVNVYKIVQAFTYKNEDRDSEEIAQVIDWAERAQLNYNILKGVLEGDIYITGLVDGEPQFALTAIGKGKTGHESKGAGQGNST